MKQQPRNRKARQGRQRVSNRDGVSRGYNDQHLAGSRRGKEDRREGEKKKENEFCRSWRRNKNAITRTKVQREGFGTETRWLPDYETQGTGQSRTRRLT